MITSSHYRTRRALLSPGQRFLSDTPGADRVYLVWEIFIRRVIPSSSYLLGDGTDRLSVFVLFVLVRSPLFLADTSGATGNKEQVLASVVHSVDIRR